MNQLAKLQQTFQEYVQEDESSTNTPWVSAKGKATPEVQLSIYSYAYHARLIEVLGNDYPAVLMAIGEEYFYELTAQYIKTYPSTFTSLRDFGTRFPNFILDLAKIEKKWQEMPWLYELAIFEYNLGQAFDAADDILFTEQDMAVIAPESWPELKFNLHSSVRQLSFEWNTVEMWQALTSETPTEITAVKEETSAWLIWREDLTTRFRSMQPDERIAFDQLAKGGDFTDICEALASIINEEEVPMHVASLLKGWIGQNLISDLL